MPTPQEDERNANRLGGVGMLLGLPNVGQRCGVPVASAATSDGSVVGTPTSFDF